MIAIQGILYHFIKDLLCHQIEDRLHWDAHGYFQMTWQILLRSNVWYKNLDSLSVNCVSFFCVSELYTEYSKLLLLFADGGI